MSLVDFLHWLLWIPYIYLIVDWGLTLNRVANERLWQFLTENVRVEEGEDNPDWDWFHVLDPDYYLEDVKAKQTMKLAYTACNLKFAVKMENPPRWRYPFPDETEFDSSKKICLVYFRVSAYCIVLMEGRVSKRDFFKKATQARFKWFIEHKWTWRIMTILIAIAIAAIFTYIGLISAS